MTEKGKKKVVPTKFCWKLRYYCSLDSCFCKDDICICVIFTTLFDSDKDDTIDVDWRTAYSDEIIESKKNKLLYIVNSFLFYYILFKPVFLK